MFHTLRSFSVLLILWCAFCVPATAQPLPGDDGVLYFPPKLTVAASATSNLRGGKEGGNSIAIRRSEQRQTDFLLPIIFFDGAGSTTISDRYQTFFSSMETDDYTDSSDMAEVPDQRSSPKYQQVLNILGYRMSVFPKSYIELEGGYSTLPGETPEVGKTRAEVVRDYLTTIWHIGPERIALRPPRRICDSSANILRQEEAQRVLIIPTPELIRPVTYYLTRSREELIFFSVMIDPAMDPADVASIELVIAMGDQVMSSTEIPGHPDSTTYNLQGLWPAFQLHGMQNTDITVQAFVRTWGRVMRQSNVVRLAVNFNIRNPRTNEPNDPYTSGYFSVPFFDWRDSTLTGLQQYYLEEYVRAFRASAPERSGQPHVMSVRAVGDRSEDAEIDEATITNTRTFQTLQGTMIKSLFAPQNRFPIAFIDGEGRDQEESIITTWLGEEYVRQVREQQEKSMESDAVGEEYSYEAHIFDSTMQNIIRGRGNRIARYLQERIGGDLHDSITVHADIDLPYSYVLFPDQRYYQRMVTITLEPFYEYDEDESIEYNDSDEYIPDEAVPEEYVPEEAVPEEYVPEER